MSDDLLLEEAIEAIENGQTEQAREILARLLKSDPQNATYWVWMSAVATTRKEQIYCLNTARKIDPHNEAARRGLVFWGALTETDVQPFPLKRVIDWQDTLRLQPEEEQPEGIRGLLANPSWRIAGIGIGLLVLVVGVFLLISRPQVGQFQLTLTPTETPGALPTHTATPRPPENAAAGPTPLAALFNVDYTPTPLYVQPEHDVQTREIVRAAITEYQRGNLDLALSYFQQLLDYEPDATDGHYYLGEIYRQQGDYEAALTAYNQAIESDAYFGPAYLGRALTQLARNPKANVLNDLIKATEYAPDFIDAWLALGRYQLAANRLDDAAEAAQAALNINPQNAPAHALLAEIALAQDDLETAQREAQTANELDLTLLSAYRLLAKIHFAQGDLEAAYEPIKLYTTYRDDDPEAWTIRAFAENARQDYDKALLAAQQALELDALYGEAYLALAEAYLGLGEGAEAEYNFKTAQKFFPRSFAISLGIAHAQAMQGKEDQAYQQVERARTLAQTEEEQVQYHYWRAYYLEAIDRHDLALSSWQALLEFPPELVPADWRALAEEKIAE